MVETGTQYLLDVFQAPTHFYTRDIVAMSHNLWRASVVTRSGAAAVEERPRHPLMAPNSQQGRGIGHIVGSSIAATTRLCGHIIALARAATSCCVKK